MTCLEDEFVESINRINFIFLNEDIKIECIKTYEGFSLLNEKIGPFEKGKEYRMKFFKAIPLIENNVFKLSETEKCDSNIVQRHAISERDNQKLVKQDTTFFLDKIREFKKFLEMDINRSLRPQLDKNRYDSYIMSILDNRLIKLLKLTMTELSIDDERRLTSSEQVLFNRIYKLVHEWRKFYLN